ncbi:MAG: diguanylate cyclase [Candidatus Omnitrophica bacterium]|nr:diguanylate cyclase [Candidatus Omnitrophota bacterium]MDD5488001.1 diguanylate cyclase [Candidatus Omnitrophota bacterium]
MSAHNPYILNILTPEVIDRTSLLVIGFDVDGRLLYWNERAREVTGHSKADILKAGMPLLFRCLIPSGSLKSIKPTAESQSIQLKEKEISIRNRSGEIRHLRLDLYLVRSTRAKGRVAVILTAVDITYAYLLQNSLRSKNHYIQTTTNRLKRYLSLDPHTGLLNYRHFIHKLSHLFYVGFENNEPLSLLMINIDYFSSINSTYGVARGNQILKKIAELIKANVPAGFSVGRFGGTEFGVLMPATDIKSAFAIAGKLFTKMTDLNFSDKKHDVTLNLSLNMAIGGHPHCAGAGSPEQLLGIVMDKLNDAKRTGANSILICSPNRAVEHKTDAMEEFQSDNGDYKYTLEFVHALANTVKTKDLYTQEHSMSMSGYAASIADFMGLNQAEIQRIRFGSILHDIGKIGIDRMILLKPTALTRGEFETIKQHPRIGAEIIRNVRPLKNVVPYVLYHHERYNGSGYLEGLRGDEIPLGARIISLADVFQALISNRPYRKPLPEEEAIGLIKTYSGKYFDPKVVKAFLEVHRA